MSVASRFTARLGSRPRSDAGATMIEYALMVGLVALVALTMVALFGQGVLGLFDRAVDGF